MMVHRFWREGVCRCPMCEQVSLVEDVVRIGGRSLSYLLCSTPGCHFAEAR